MLLLIIDIQQRYLSLTRDADEHHQLQFYPRKTPEVISVKRETTQRRISMSTFVDTETFIELDNMLEWRPSRTARQKCEENKHQKTRLNSQGSSPTAQPVCNAISFTLPTACYK